MNTFLVSRRQELIDMLFSNQETKSKAAANKIFDSDIDTVLEALNYAFANFSEFLPREYLETGTVPYMTAKRSAKIYYIKRLNSGIVDYNRIKMIFDEFDNAYKESEKERNIEEILNMLVQGKMWVLDYVSAKSKQTAVNAINEYYRKLHKKYVAKNESIRKLVPPESILWEAVEKLIEDNVIYIIPGEKGYEYKKGKKEEGVQYWHARTYGTSKNWTKEFKSKKLDSRAKEKPIDKKSEQEPPPKPASGLGDEIEKQMAPQNLSKYYEGADSELVKRAQNADSDIVKKVGRFLSGIVFRAAKLFFPLPVDVLLEFLSYRKKRFEIKGKKHRRALYYSCKAAEKRLGKDASKETVSIHYTDYYGGQILDPKVTNPKPIIFSASPKKPSGREKYLPTDPYQGLSVTLGSAKFKKLKNGGYVVGDRYDFNVIRKNTDKPADYVLTVANIAGGKKKARKMFKNKSYKWAIEEYMVWREIKDNYKGFEIICRTKGSDYYENKKAKKVKKSKKVSRQPVASKENIKSLPEPKDLSWITVTSVTEKEIKGILKNDKKTRVVYKSGTIPYINTIKDLKK